ncbi:uncharacterized protein LOC102802350 [Saccoglossus kowalevskii]|uniref:Uncharacterized protein LOC102802350 n=1 Tax=Saccoglossus kowalevskii TaxID=10224 RepID=A0ABM0ME94_SACKO|nr:PREDICTED: uncharacterized protein LOC102802350 [Saccoglossus kowalevskii]
MADKIMADSLSSEKPEDKSSQEERSGNGQNLIVDEEEQEKQAERELTQTDHLNKKLLSSFLDRLNQAATQFPEVERARELEEDGRDNKLAEEGFED